MDTSIPVVSWMPRQSYISVAQGAGGKGSLFRLYAPPSDPSPSMTPSTALPMRHVAMWRYPGDCF